MVKIKKFSHHANGVHVHDIISGIDETYFAEGNVWTLGIFGIKSWSGPFSGSLILRIPLGLSLGGVSETYYCGAFGFTGFRLFFGSKNYYFGFALAVNLDETNK